MTEKNISFNFGAGVSSMTGFGRSEKNFPGINISVEIRTVNNRFCEIGMKIPRELNAMESEIRDRIRSRLARGRINLLITLDRDPSDDSILKIDLRAADLCRQKLVELGAKLGTNEPVTLEHLLHFSDYFTAQPDAELSDTLRQQILAALDEALAGLLKMRRSEGISLAEDLLERIEAIDKIRLQIQELAADQPKLQMEKLNERLDLLINSGPVDPGRLEQEMAFLADKLDISEECVRLESHCHRFLEALKGDEPAGKKLGFLLQELNREANTISAKSASAEISHLAVNLKEEIERAREQIQNLE